MLVSDINDDINDDTHNNSSGSTIRDSHHLDNISNIPFGCGKVITVLSWHAMECAP